MAERADEMVKLGQLATEQRDVWWNAQVAQRLKFMGLPVPKEMAAKAGLDLANPAAVQVTEQAGAAVVRETAGGTAKSVLRGGAPIAAALFAAESAWAGIQYARGKIDGEEAGKRIGESAASNGGALGTASAFAAAGTLILPGVGTAIGAALGGLVGGVGGRWMARKLLRRRAQVPNDFA